MKPIWNEYKAKMRSIYQLFKTEAKFSDKESLLAQEERRLIREKEQNLLKKNEEINDKVLRQQLQDDEEKLKIKIAEAEKKLFEKMKLEELYRQEADQKVKILKEKAKTFIDPNKLDQEINKMLDERVDYNFSVDSSGIFKRKGKIIEPAWERFNPKFIPKEEKKEENIVSKESKITENSNIFQ